MSTTTDIASLRLLGGSISLDFANTIDPRHGSHPYEYLTDFSDLVAWSVHTASITSDKARRLLAEAALHRSAAESAFAYAKTLREVIYRIFAAQAHTDEPAAADLDWLGEAYRQALGRSALTQPSDGFRWALNDDPLSFNYVADQVALSAVDLLISADRARVKECPGIDGCGWLFLDASKNGSRRWCSMDGCGSQAKMRRLNTRKRTTRG